MTKQERSPAVIVYLGLAWLVALVAFGVFATRIDAQTREDHRLRCLYLQEVWWIGEVCQDLRREGYCEESVARAAHLLRREIGQEYKAISSPAMQAKIRERNLAKYGDPLGPTIDYLRAKGLTWREIAEGACTPGGEDVIKSNCPCLPRKP